jgi:glucoamylase
VPQNSWTHGTSFAPGIQLDQTASLVLLAWRLRAANALGRFDPWPVLAKAVSFLISSGPVTGQDRREENGGISPSTLAAVIAGITAAADFAADQRLPEIREFMLAYADWMNAYVEKWTVTNRGSLHPKVKRHYVRMTPMDPLASELGPDPDHAEIEIGNGGGWHPVSTIVSGDFLQLVRLGLRAANDPLILDSLRVIDHVLKRDLPGGPAWRRYNHDGYGQKADGEPFNGTGVGRCWPLLTGERGHHAIAAGQDARPFLATMETFANEGGLLPEQVWDDPNLDDGSCRLGAPTGSAMPLCWSHAEYLILVRSQRDGKVFDRIEPAYQRYAKRTSSREFHYEFWSPRYRRAQIIIGKRLRIVTAAATCVRWTNDHWHSHVDSEASSSGLSQLWFVDVPTEKLPPGSQLEFTFYWTAAQRWEGVNFTVTMAES